MPSYDYICADCGPFCEIRPMSQSDEPCACPACGAEAPRALLRVPYFSMMDRAMRTANAANERSRHAPRVSSERGEKSYPLHGATCGCCKPGGKSSAVLTADGAKGFPSKRPWMISH